jgi:hypothetical protein
LPDIKPKNRYKIATKSQSVTTRVAFAKPGGMETHARLQEEGPPVFERDVYSNLAPKYTTNSESK